MTVDAETLPRLKQGSSGLRVKAVKRALHAALGPDAHNSQGTPRFGYRTVRDVILFQHRNRISTSGVVGPVTWAALMPLMDGKARMFLRLARERDARSAEDRARDGLVHVAFAIIAVGASRWRYAQVRPYPRLKDLEGDVRTDCSGAVEIIYYMQGDVEDPSGVDYDGSGYTGTLRAHGRKITLGEAKRGALAHYGGPDHVVMLLEDSPGRRVFSFGSNPPSVRDVFYRTLVMVTENVRLKGD